MDALQLLDAARLTRHPQTWYALARDLGTDDGTLAGWRRRGGAYDDDAAWRLAAMVGILPSEAIAIRNASRAKSEEERRVWWSRAGKAAGVAAVGLFLSMNGALPAADPLPTLLVGALGSADKTTYQLYAAGFILLAVLLCFRRHRR